MSKEHSRAIQRLRAANIQRERLTNQQVADQFSDLVWLCMERRADKGWCDACPDRKQCLRLYQQLNNKCVEGRLLVKGRYPNDAAAVAEKLLDLLARASGVSLEDDALLIEDSEPELQVLG